MVAAAEDYQKEQNFDTSKWPSKQQLELNNKAFANQLRDLSMSNTAQK